MLIIFSILIAETTDRMTRLAFESDTDVSFYNPKLFFQYALLCWLGWLVRSLRIEGLCATVAQNERATFDYSGILSRLVVTLAQYPSILANKRPSPLLFCTRVRAPRTIPARFQNVWLPTVSWIHFNCWFNIAIQRDEMRRTKNG